MRQSRAGRRAAGLAVTTLLGSSIVGGALTGSALAVGGHHRHHLAVTGFQSEGSRSSRISANAKALATVAVDGVGVRRDGASVATPDSGARRERRVAHSKHLRAEFVVSNWDKSIGDFSEAIAHHLLGSPDNVAAVAGDLARTVRTQHWNGVNIDLEALQPRDRDGLVAFLSALHADLPGRRSLSVDVSNQVTAAGFRAGGYDLRGIAGTVDRIILMAYDEHGPWEPHPGPVGALRWQKRGLATVLRTVPAKQIDLGQAGYGYAWRPHRTQTLSDARARRLVRTHHATAHFNKRIGEWTAHLSDGSTVWWADARSYRLRAALARRDHLHGLAVWSLGLSDPIG